MASIHELFRTGFVLDKISGAPESPWMDAELRLRHRPDLDVSKILHADPAAGVLVEDLQEYLADRLYDRKIICTSIGLSESGLMAWELIARESNEWRRYQNEGVCARITTVQEGKRLKIILPYEADKFYPEVGIEPHFQRAGLLQDYAQIFAFTERAIRSGRHVLRR